MDKKQSKAKRVASLSESSGHAKHSDIKSKASPQIVKSQKKRNGGILSKHSSPNPSMNGSAPRIDLFGGGSFFSEKTKNFLGLGLNKKPEESSSNEITGNEMEEGSDYVDDSVQEQTVWNSGQTFYNDSDTTSPQKASKKDSLDQRQNGFDPTENGSKRPEIWI